MSKPTLLERVQQILDDHDEACLMTEGCYGLTSGAADEIVALLAEHDRQVAALPTEGCACTPHSQYAGGGHYEHLLEYDPACPEHSEHIWGPRTGMWELLAEHDRQVIEAALRPVRQLFAGGPDTPCRTTWRLYSTGSALFTEDAVQCIEVPTDDLREALDRSVGSCPCGKPLSHLDADPDGPEWSCRMPPSVR